MLGRLGMRLGHPKSLLFFYLFTVTATIIWILTNLATWCPPSKQEPGYPHVISQGEHIMRMQRTQIQQLEEQFSQREKTLNQIESKLKQMYPDDLEALLSIHEDEGPTIYAITPTHTRPVQKAELTRLSQTFLHVPKFHWIVVEDSAVKTDLVTNLLRTCGLSHTHLNAMTPPDYKLQDEDPNWLKPRGVVQRNAALEWIRQELPPNQHKGVVYFADDDNTYSLELFEEMRSTRRVSVWPVGLVGKLRYESPILKNGKVHNFLTYWKPERPFAMDMAGFAINLKLLFEFSDAKFKLRVKRGYLESDFLEQITRKDELEPKADNCTKVLVWHTRTEKPSLKNEEHLKSMGIVGSDPKIEV